MNIFDLVKTSKQPINALRIKEFLERSTRQAIGNFTVKAPAGNRKYWCWAAVAQGVSRHYEPSENILQCTIAERVLQSTGCCLTTTGCDYPASLSLALRRVMHFSSHFGNWIEFERVKYEIENDRPIGCRKRDNDGHYVAISAFLENNSVKKITVLDPIYLFDQWDYEMFTQVWVNTYFTRQ